MRFSDNRHQGYDSRQGGGRRYHHHHHQQDPNRMNEETFGTTAVREQREQYNKGEYSQLASFPAWVTTLATYPYAIKKQRKARRQGGFGCLELVLYDIRELA